MQKPDSPTARLRSIDEERWDIKDAIRGHERNSDHLRSLRRIGPFGPPTNGRCAPVKRRIDERLGSQIGGAKSCAAKP